MTADTSDLDRQLTALTEIGGALATTVSRLNARVDRLTAEVCTAAAAVGPSTAR